MRISHVPLPPQLRSSTLIKNGVVKVVNHANTKPILIATPNVILRKLFEGISPAAIQDTGPIVQAYVKRNMHNNATRAFPEATLVGATVYTIAMQNMHIVVDVKPTSSNVRRPKRFASGNPRNDAPTEID